MKPSRTSKAWMREHISDPFVQRAKREGYRSRASYKLMEIDDRDRLLRPHARVLDLGAAPGGWSQVARQRLGKTGLVVGVDLLPMAPLPGVEFIQGDFTEKGCRACLDLALNHHAADLVLSDLAPNISGVELYDQARAMGLAELALEFAMETLKPDGGFLVKVFQGVDFDDYVRRMKRSFATVVTRKPAASRDRSPEVYLLGRGVKADAVEALREAQAQQQDFPQSGEI